MAGGSGPDLIPLTVPEVRRLLQVLRLPSAERRFRQHWSWWRRAHQAVARRCHIARRARSPSALVRPHLAPAPPVPTTTRPANGGAAAEFHLTNEQWDRVADLLPVLSGGRPARHRRQHLEGLLWLRQTDASWRSLPTSYGDWRTLYACYRAWQATGRWQHLLARLNEENSEVSL
jgi:hypothetical protein